MQLLRKLAFPISLIYALVVYVRNLCFDIGIFKSTSFNTPTISIGNLSVGGTGKTPMIEYLIRLVVNDYKTAVLSRGYRRKTKGFLLASESSKVEELGDEPYQIYSKFNTVELAVDANRRNGIRNLENTVEPELILLDDAFQHRKVKPSVSILLTTYSNPYYEDWYLPTGDLRDSKKEAKRAKFIIVTKCPTEITPLEKKKVISSIKPKKHQKILFSRLAYSDSLVGVDKKIELKDLREECFSLVTGIANPEPLVDYLRMNNTVFEHFKYADHYFFTQDDISSFSKNKLIVTTEKDFTKLKGRCENVFYLEVKHEFFEDGESELKELIKTIMIDSQL